jgi:arylsulfatase A-like enzyme
MKIISILLILISISAVSFVNNSKKPPNVVLVFMDDLGYGDLSCTGAVGYQTPHLDNMATEGVRFTNFLVAQAVCSASRAALMTGCYPNRIGISGALMPNAQNGINANETTLAELLKEKGYSTAIFGKWHLGHHKQFLPLQHGFDEYFGIPYSNDMWPMDFAGLPASETNFRKKAYPILPLIQNNEKVEEITSLDGQGTLTTRYTEKAIDFIKRNKNKPFFLYLPHSMPHVPINASAKFKGKSQQGLYGDVMMEMDWSIGEILKTLKDTGIDKNTLVIFTSDNGPWLKFGNHAGSSGGFREGKGTSFEGGHRVPCIMRWKGALPEGVICNKMASTIDILPTIANLCGTKLPNNKIDGVDISALMKGNLEATPRKTFYYYYKKNSLEAVRKDDWKLVLEHPGLTYEGFIPGKDGFDGEVNDNSPVAFALYDLRRDLGERYDVQKSNPKIVEELLKLAEEAREDLGDDITKRTGKNRRQAGILKD